MPFKFRLKVATKREGVFRFATAVETFVLPDGIQLSVVARDAELLENATSFHFEAGGFETKALATDAGEALRVKLGFLNARLGLGINIPVGNTPASTVGISEAEIAREVGCIAIGGVWGLNVFPDDGRHVEVFIAGRLNARPNDPMYVFRALQTIWPAPTTLDAASELALQILNIATLETSEKAAFLTSYLALEQLVERRPRSAVAQDLLVRFQRQIDKAAGRKYKPLTKAEATSLKGALQFGPESFPTALARLARQLGDRPPVQGMTVKKFFSTCVKVRNGLSHDAQLIPSVPLQQLIEGLRETVLGLIWGRNQLPDLVFQTPASSVASSYGPSLRML